MGSGKMVGRKFGSLIVTRLEGKHVYANRLTDFWYCTCDCGNVEIYNTTQLRLKKHSGEPRITACSICRRKPCIVCGATVTTSTSKKTCSPACALIHKRNGFNAHYAKLVGNDPDHNRKKHQQIKARMDVDTTYAERVRAVGRASKKRYRDDPKNADAIRERSAKAYAENREHILAQRKRFFNSLSIEDQEKIRERNRGFSRESARKFREWLYANPSEYDAYMKRRREWLTATELLKLEKINDSVS